MKNLVLIIVLLFFMKPIFPIVDFVINYDAIQELCINKSKPELECNGTCHLKTELAKTAQDENPFTSKRTVQLQQEVLFFNPFQWKFDQPITTLVYATKIADSYFTNYHYLPTLDLVKPPLV